MNAFKDHDIVGAQKAYIVLTGMNEPILSTITESQFKFWVNYMDMVSILLNFIRAEREGKGELHLI